MEYGNGNLICCIVSSPVLILAVNDIENENV